MQNKKIPSVLFCLFCFFKFYFRSGQKRYFAAGYLDVAVEWLFDFVGYLVTVGFDIKPSYGSLFEVRRVNSGGIRHLMLILFMVFHMLPVVKTIYKFVADAAFYCNSLRFE